VDIDQAAYEKYQRIPAGPLRTLMDTSILCNSAGPDGSRPAVFAHVRMLPSNHCPLLTPQRLCRIQVEHGGNYLSTVCSTFPRRTCTIDGLEEKTLSLSCPEAARLVLLDPHLLPAADKGGYQMTWDDRPAKALPVRNYFWPIREFAVTLIRNRAYPLWQRLFLLGIFSRRLDALARGESDRGFPVFLRDFSAAVGSGTLRTSIETIPADLALQLGMVLRLVSLRAAKGPNEYISVAMERILRAFVEGIGYAPAIPIEALTDRYASAYESCYAPFFLRHEHILENYLINMIFRGLFPFGEKLFEPTAIPEAGKAFSSLATQFALVKGLLIGAAGYYRQAFSAEHVVAVVQSAFKHFEHNPEFLLKSQQLLASKGLDNAHGLTMLLRN
jgi:lysine-N-methylase